MHTIFFCNWAFFLLTKVVKTEKRLSLSSDVTKFLRFIITLSLLPRCPEYHAIFFLSLRSFFLLTKIMKLEKRRSSASDVTKFLLLVITLALLLYKKFLILKKQCDIAYTEKNGDHENTDDY